jgi:hypothetical protein
MRWLKRAVLIASLLALGSSGGLAAQRAPEHRGIWLGAGLGMGSARLSCSICRAGRDGGTSGYLRVGATITPRILLGAETNVWYRSENDLSFLLGSLLGVVYLYPTSSKSFYLKTGLGLAQYSAKDNDDEVSTQALAGTIGIGYEVLIARNISLVPFANFLGTTGADVRFNDTVSDLSANTSLIQLGVGVTLH